MLLGVLVMLRTGCWVAMLASWPSLCLALLISWVLIRTIPFFSIHGFDAARDSVIAVYGIFAFIVVAVILERPERLQRLVAAYSGFAWFFGFFGIALMFTSPMLGSAMPNWPGTDIPLIFTRLGECATHLAGAVTFAMLGLRRVSRSWIVVALISVCSVSISRGAMLACLLPTMMAATMMRGKEKVLAVLSVAVLLFSIGYVVDIDIKLEGGRTVGPRMMLNGIGSIIGTSDESNLDGTKRWRLSWWDTIINYTVHGPYFWTGKGFGVNLAIDDGHVVGQEQGGPPLRSPHNGHMTMLARAGVPGLFLWLATILTWYGALFHAMLVARRNGHQDWASLFLWIACYGSAFVVDATFDVALEGPMLGIWFWCVFGFGIAATMVYRNRGTPSHLLGRTTPLRKPAASQS